jgi:hypothetical protein
MHSLSTRRRLQISRNAAVSRFNNPHNFEYNWYPFWNLVTTRIAALVEKHHCFVAPQCVLWRLRDFGEDPRKPEIQKVYIGDDIDMEGGEVGGNGEDLEAIGDASFSSVASTITRAQDRKRITDFAILVWENTAGRDEEDEEEDETLTFDDDTEGNAESKIQESIPVLCEVKRQPSRSSDEVTDTMEDFVLEAKDDVLFQVRAVLPLS